MIQPTSVESFQSNISCQIEGMDEEEAAADEYDVHIFRAISQDYTRQPRLLYAKRSGCEKTGKNERESVCFPPKTMW